MKRIFYVLLLSSICLSTTSISAAAGSSWFGGLFGAKDQPKYPAVSPLRALGVYIADNLADTTIYDDEYGTRPQEGFDTWFTKHVESVNILKNAARQRHDIVDKASNKLNESAFTVTSPTHEYEFSVNVPASLKTRSTMPVQDILESTVDEPLVLHVKVRNIQTHNVAGEYDLLVTKQIELGHPSTYTLYDGAGTYATADRKYTVSER
jgi:hypothetical protein